MDIFKDESKRGKGLISVSHHVNKLRQFVLWYLFMMYWYIPSRELTYPTEREKDNYVQNAFKKRGYVSSKEGIRLHFSCFVYGKM